MMFSIYAHARIMRAFCGESCKTPEDFAGKTTRYVTDSSQPQMLSSLQKWSESCGTSYAAGIFARYSSSIEPNTVTEPRTQF